jgi:4'-phosphopantetheinyl transferase
MICWLLDERMPVWNEDPPAFLNPVETSSLAGKRFPKRRAEWLHGRWVAKNLLQKGHPACMELPLSEILIANEPGGAPYATLADGSRLAGCLSITHSGSLAACTLALDPGLRVGIDLEKIEARPTGFFETYFNPPENAYLRNCPPETLPEVLTLLWSAKESVLKALRKGLSLDTRQVEIKLVEGDGGLSRRWQRFRAAGNTLDSSTPGSGPWVWAGWWQVYQGYILTLAAASQAGELGQRLGGEIPLQVG